MKKTPFSAFFIREPIAGGFTDSFSVSSCLVVGIERDRAEIVTRCGGKYVREFVPLNCLASNPTRFADRVADHLSALLARAPQPAVAVMTADSAETAQLAL